MSQYIQLKTSFFTHRKTMRLRALIGDDAMWVMPALWCYALNSQPDGDFSKWSGPEIAMAIGYTKAIGQLNEEHLVNCMKEAGFMDSERKLTNWMEHQSYARTAKERAEKAAAARWAEPEEPQAERKTKARCTSDEAKEYCKSVGLPESDGEWFFDKMEGSGWKNGGNPVKDWKATIRAWNKAGYMASQRTNGIPPALRRAGWSDIEYSKAQLSKLRDDLKFSPPEKRDEIRAAIAKHEAVVNGGGK